jgi:hypothetical protein
MIRYLLSPVRCLVQVALALYGFVLAALAVAGASIVIGYYPAALAMRAATDLGRRLAQRWGGVQIHRPPRETPPEPERRDGWYVHNNQLFKNRGFPEFMIRLEWLSRDGTLTRDWLWLAFAPFTAALATAVPLLLVGGAVALMVTDTVPLAAIPLVALAFALGPSMLRAHALISRVLLRPSHESWWHRSGLSG